MAFADFLRARREALTPGDVGLTVGPRRRAPGLRREEVAQLTGMSVDYYSRLEQRRGPQPSVSMLSALARTLRLSLDERDHLFRLAGHPAPERTAGSTFVRPALLHVLDQLDDCAPFVASDLEVVLAQNRLSILLMGDSARWAPASRPALCGSGSPNRTFLPLPSRRVGASGPYQGRQPASSLVAPPWRRRC
jgi:transcriptional regulator with XRE-family HTH domain